VTPQAATLIPHVSERIPAISEASAIVNMIERATRDPSVDIEKMERLMAMHERLLDREAEQAFNDAMRLAQAEMEPVRNNASNPQTRSKYATLQAVDAVLRPIYNKHGFSISYDTGDGAPENHVRVLAYVSRGRFTRTYKQDMPADGKGAKGNDVMTKTHAAGSAMTYGRRYLLGGIFNVTFTNDDDGNAASGRRGAVSSGDTTATISDAAAEKLRDDVQTLVSDMKMDITAFLDWVSTFVGARVESISDIPANDVSSIVAKLEIRKRKVGAAK
jgi:hypothetical protein